MRRIDLICKRLMDVLSSVLGLIVFFPFLFLISLMIKFESKGPVFFRQERLGKSGKIFKIYKFRSMIVGAEKLGDGLTIKDNSDIRITKIGQFLRVTSLDEIPQLINVLMGDMSLVGPRPPVVYFPYDGYENYPEWTKPRFQMKPGITGLTQVTVRNSVSWEERIKIDLKYIDDFSLWLDVKLLFKTFGKVVNSKSIYK